MVVFSGRNSKGRSENAVLVKTFVTGREFMAFWSMSLLFIGDLIETALPALVDICHSIKCSVEPLLNLCEPCVRNSLCVSFSEINSYMQ